MESEHALGVPAVRVSNPACRLVRVSRMALGNCGGGSSRMLRQASNYDAHALTPQPKGPPMVSPPSMRSKAIEAAARAIFCQLEGVPDCQENAAHIHYWMDDPEPGASSMGPEYRAAATAALDAILAVPTREEDLAEELRAMLNTLKSPSPESGV